MASTHDFDIDKRNENIIVYIDGEFHLRSEAKISVMDSGYLLGDGVWEGIRLHKNVLLHLDQHLNRLYEGASSIAMNIELTKNEMKLALERTIEKNNMSSDVHIRLIVSRGLKLTPYQHPKVTIGRPTVVIIPEYKIPSNSIKLDGITLGTVKTIRDHRVQDPKINSLSKHNCIAACIEADKLGVDEGLMLDQYGYVSTCNSTNFFIVYNNEVWTSTGEYCLNGVTRGNIIKICKANDVKVFEKNFLLDDVYLAQEVFVTGTFAGVIPVKSVDGFIVGDGKIGPLTKMLQDWYANSIEIMVAS
tara:strand:+ start:233 stop:1141 length:909 start_codon:yes stop_codon:yes gene_type:complete